MSTVGLAVGSAPAIDAADPARLRAPRRRAKALLSLLRSAEAPNDAALAEQLATWRDLGERLSDHALLDVAADPLFAYWWAELVRRHTDADAAAAWLRELPRFLVVPALDEGVWPEGTALELPLTPSGEARPAGTPRHLRIGGSRCEATLDGDDLVLRGDTSLRVPAASLLGGKPAEGVVRRTTVGRSAIELDATDPWTVGLLETMNAQAPVGPYPRRDLEPLTDVPEALRATYEECLALIGAAWPELLRELETHVRLVVPFRSDLLVGWTHVLFPGAIFVRSTPGDLAFTAERLVHEEAHTRLYALAAEPLHENAPTDLFPSPLRLDRRPADGVYHAVFVTGRVLEFWARAAEATGELSFRSRALELVPTFRAGFGTLTEAVDLTPFGRELLLDLGRRVETLDLHDQGER